MKKIFVVFVLFCAFLIVSCGGSSKNVGSKENVGKLAGPCYPDKSCDEGLVCDEEKNLCVEDSDDFDSVPDEEINDSDDVDPQNSDSDDVDTVSEEEVEDSTDSEENDTDTDDSTQTPCDPNPCQEIENSTGECTLTENQTSHVCDCVAGYFFDGSECINNSTLPECSPTSNTPCIDKETELIWSGRSVGTMTWSDAVDYCEELKEGGYSDWRLPSIKVLRTLVKDCEKTDGCTGDAEGRYSKFGDIVFLWSKTTDSSSIYYGVYFFDGSTTTKDVEANFNVRCVRREGSETRQTNCSGLPENAEWNTVSSITQNWDWDDMWIPSLEPYYSEENGENECRFKCSANYFYNISSESCESPCDPNPCSGVNQSTGECSVIDRNTFECVCVEGAYWKDSQCLKPCDENPCEDVLNTTGCNNVGNSFECICKEGYEWTYNFYCKTLHPLSLGNICTGQDKWEKCYDNYNGMERCPEEDENYYGQDMQNSSKCTPPSFTAVRSRGVVIDNNTGLVWEQSPSTDTYNWGNAANHCADLNELRYAGIDNWRLPTMLELNTIFDIGRHSPAMPADDDGNPFFTNIPQYQGTDTYLGASNAYVGLPDYGFTGSGSEYSTHDFNVLCVSGDELPTGKFEEITVSNLSFVKDKTTNLIWQKDFVTGKNWQYALAYCQNLRNKNYAGYSDWRLPNKNELLSLSNYNKTGTPYSDFPGVFNGYYWSSSSYHIDDNNVTSAAWLVNFNNNIDVVHKSKDSSYTVRCVQ